MNTRSLTKWKVSASPEVPPPPVEAWFARDPGPRWLEDTARRLAASASSFDRAAAAGLVVRLWHAQGTERARDSLRRLMAGEPTPWSVPHTWFAGLGAEVHAAVERWAHARLHDLLEELPEIAEGAVAGDGTARGRLLGWLHVRDDLESVARLLGELGWFRVAKELRCLDEEAAVRGTAWLFVEAFDDARLFAAGADDPDCWWGSLAAW
jgi:hypothetical protein